MNKKNLTPEFCEKLLDKPVELSLQGGQTCEAVVKKFDDKSLTVKEIPTGKMLVFGLEKIQKIHPIDE
ncbi:MAG: hypothetical protein ACP5NV_02850 [Candidatus Woesearchaeota archaeon]